MVEVTDQEFTMIKDFVINDLGDAVDWQNAPEELKKKYTDVVQILNAFGQDQQQGQSQDMGMAAPGA